MDPLGPDRTGGKIWVLNRVRMVCENRVFTSFLSTYY